MKKLNNILTILVILTDIFYLVLSILNENIPIIFLTIISIPIFLLTNIIKNKIEHTETMRLFYIIFMILFLLLGAIIGFYKIFYNYDMIAHFITGISASILSLFVLKKLNKYEDKSLGFNILFMIMFSMMIAGIWEIIEFNVDIIFKLDVQRVVTTGIYDTMKDIILALVGSILFSFIYFVIEKKNKKIINKII